MRFAPRSLIKAIVIGALGCAAALLVACGDDSGLLSGRAASSLGSELDGVVAACASGQNDRARAAAARFERGVEGLSPRRTDRRLIRNLRQGASTLGQLVQRGCDEPEETVATQTQIETVTTPAEPETTTVPVTTTPVEPPRTETTPRDVPTTPAPPTSNDRGPPTDRDRSSGGGGGGGGEGQGGGRGGGTGNDGGDEGEDEVSTGGGNPGVDEGNPGGAVPPGQRGRQR